jgi:DNA-nicking Smr family endonuclease
VSTRRKKIRVLDDWEDPSVIFAGQDVSGSSADPSEGGENDFSTMIDDTLSGLDQAEIIKQKYPDADLRKDVRHRRSPSVTSQADLDLHGCYVHEAVARVETFIETSRRQGLTAVRLIVGKGLHSQGGAVLPGAVEEKIVDLKRRGRVFTFAWEKKKKKTSGSLIVFLQ